MNVKQRIGITFRFDESLRGVRGILAVDSDVITGTVVSGGEARGLKLDAGDVVIVGVPSSVELGGGLWLTCNVYAKVHEDHLELPPGAVAVTDCGENSLGGLMIHPEWAAAQGKVKARIPMTREKVVYSSNVDLSPGDDVFVSPDLPGMVVGPLDAPCLSQNVVIAGVIDCEVVAQTLEGSVLKAW